MSVFRIEDYGATGDGVCDCTKAFYKMLDDAKKQNDDIEMIFGSGSFLISDVLEITGMKNVKIKGQGNSTLLLQSNPKCGGIWADHCDNIQISGFAFDMSVLPYCEGIVKNIGDYFVEIEVADEFKDKFEQPWFKDRVQNFASVVRNIGKTHYHMQEVVWYKRFDRLSSNMWRVHLLDDGGIARCGITPGDGMYFLSRGGGKDVAFNACDCKELKIKNLTVYSGCSLTMGLRRNENLTIKNIQTREKNGRMISTNADGIHASDNRGHFEISGCYFEGMADDGINVFNHNSEIEKVISDNELLMSSGFQGREGDHLQVIDLHKHFRVKGESIIKKTIKEDDGIKVVLCEPIQGMLAGKSKLKADDGIEMTVTGDQVYIREACADLHIHDCYFARHRGREILAHCNCLIENNVFDNNSAVSIFVTMDTSWPEGPVPGNVIIRGNKFISGSSIPGQPVITANWIADDGYLKNIMITDNIFTGPIFAKVIDVANCTDLVITNNTFPEGIEKEIKISGTETCHNVIVDILK